jgi:hypothetical protein
MFFLNQQQELLVYRYSGKSDHTINSYDRLAAENTGYPLDGAKSTDEYNVDQVHAMSYVQSVAFDPTGSGRKDHIAFIGVYADEFKNDKTPSENEFVTLSVDGIAIYKIEYDYEKGEKTK